jgi:hypothetical protein
MTATLMPAVSLQRRAEACDLLRLPLDLLSLSLYFIAHLHIPFIVKAAHTKYSRASGLGSTKIPNAAQPAPAT